MINYTDNQQDTALAISKREPVYSLVTNSTINTVNGIGGATFERILNGTETATVVNRYGEVESFTKADTPRVGKHGLLLEPEATNNILHSEDVSNAVYTQIGVTIGVPSLSPDGINNYQELIESNATSNRQTNYQNETSTDPQSTSITMQRKVKRGVGSRNVTLYCAGGGFQGSDRFGTTFDLANGISLSGTDSAGVGVLLGNSIKALTDGWFLISITGSITGTLSTSALNCMAISEDTYISGSIGETRTGDGVSSIICGGIQTELGSIATSYIPTTTGLLVETTRSRETLSADPRNFPSIVSGVTIHEVWYSDDWSLNNVGDLWRTLLYAGSETGDNLYIYILNGVLTASIDSRDGGAIVAKHILYDVSSLNALDIKFVMDTYFNFLYINGVLVGSVDREGDDILFRTPSILNYGSWRIENYEANAQRKSGAIYDYAMTAEQARL